MSATSNKELVRRLIEQGWGARDGAPVLDALLADDVVDHQPLGRIQPGKAGQLDLHAMFFQAFEIDLKIEHLVAEGDLVVDHWQGDLTHIGDFLGMAATGLTVQVSALDLHRIVNGEVAESWHLEDLMQAIEPIRQAAAVAESGT